MTTPKMPDRLLLLSNDLTIPNADYVSWLEYRVKEARVKYAMHTTGCSRRDIKDDLVSNCSCGLDDWLDVTKDVP